MIGRRWGGHGILADRSARGFFRGVLCESELLPGLSSSGSEPRWLSGTYQVESDCRLRVEPRLRYSLDSLLPVGTEVHQGVNLP